MFRAYDNNTNQIASDSITVVCTVPGGGLDSDGDGMPDFWEAQNGLNYLVSDATQDADGDGLTNYQEYLAGTDPRDARSSLRLDAAAGANNTVNLTFTAVAGRSYTLQQRNLVDNGGWTRLTNFTARLTNRVAQATVPATETNRFYRLVTPLVP